MKVVQLKSDSIKNLRTKRLKIIESMVDDSDYTILALRPAYAGVDRSHPLLSFAVFSIFFELWDRFTFESWSFTFDREGLIFYVMLSMDASKVKDVLIHYEDNHPLGFAIDSDVFDQSDHYTRSKLGVPARKDIYFKKDLEELLNEEMDDRKYRKKFLEDIESFMLKGSKAQILSNALLYSYVAAFNKQYGFGMYGPSFRGSNEKMNFEKFIHLLRSYKESVLNIFSYNSRDIYSVKEFVDHVEEQIQLSLLNQDSYQFTVFMTSVVLFAFIRSRGYVDISDQIKTLTNELNDIGMFREDVQRYECALNGMKDVFNHYVPFYQKHQNVVSTFLYILSRNEDYSILENNGQKNLLKAKFLTKNLVFKEENWSELNQFFISNNLYPHDSTILLSVTCMLDFFQRNYLNIKILFDTNS